MPTYWEPCPGNKNAMGDILHLETQKDLTNQGELPEIMPIFFMAARLMYPG
jgi:hypothetical protein